jgi:excinuclease UvrABC nuclease subunit
LYLLENYGKLEFRAGVYIFANASLQTKYIGKAGAGRMVLEINSAIRRGKAFGATLLKALYTNSDANALSLENALRVKYNPPNNLSIATEFLVRLILSIQVTTNNLTVSPTAKSYNHLHS